VFRDWFGRWKPPCEGVFRFAFVLGWCALDQGVDQDRWKSGPVYALEPFGYGISHLSFHVGGLNVGVGAGLLALSGGLEFEADRLERSGFVVLELRPVLSIGTKAELGGIEEIRVRAASGEPPFLEERLVPVLGT
jgi:hypothetical protein